MLGDLQLACTIPRGRREGRGWGGHYWLGIAETKQGSFSEARRAQGFPGPSRDRGLINPTRNMLGRGKGLVHAPGLAVIY